MYPVVLVKATLATTALVKESHLGDNRLDNNRHIGEHNPGKNPYISILYSYARRSGL